MAVVKKSPGKPINPGTLMLMLSSAEIGTYITAVEDRGYIVMAAVFVKVRDSTWKVTGAHSIGDQYQNDAAMAELVNWNTVAWCMS